MATFLFEEAVFGPIKSRRLGKSLGVNLLPTSSKHCNFDCIYCECGRNGSRLESKEYLIKVEEFRIALELRLRELRELGQKIDAITFAGNGEPTLHPRFGEIVDVVAELRDKYFSSAKIALLSNGIRLRNDTIAMSLRKIDQCIIKLDAGDNELFHLINQPVKEIKLSELIDLFVQFQGELILQSLFLKGEFAGRDICNLYPEQVKKWLGLVQKIKPSYVMLYTLDRDTPVDGLIKASEIELNGIKGSLANVGIKSEVYV